MWKWYKYIGVVLTLALGTAVAAQDRWPSSSGGGTGIPIVNPAWARQTVATDVSTTSGTVYAAVTDLDKVLVAGTNYAARCELWVTGASATVGLQLQIQGPTVTEMHFSRAYASSSIAVNFTSGAAFHTAAQDDGALTSDTGGFADQLSLLALNPSAGTVALAFVSEVDGTAVTLQAGSWCEWSVL